MKRVGDRRQPCLTPTIVLNHSPILPFIWTAHEALSFSCSMERTRFSYRTSVKQGQVSDTEASVLDSHLSISDCFVKTKICDKKDDFDFDIVNFSFLHGDVPRSTYHGVSINSKLAKDQYHINPIQKMFGNHVSYYRQL